MNWRQKFARWITRSKATSLMVGSFISTGGERCVAISLKDGYRQSNARLSPEGAEAFARQLNEWASWAKISNARPQWEFIIRMAADEVENVKWEKAEGVGATPAVAE